MCMYGYESNLKASNPAWFGMMWYNQIWKPFVFHTVGSSQTTPHHEYKPRQASALLWCTDVDLGNAQRYARFANGRPGNPKVARLWRWQWPKSLIFLVPSKRKRIEPTQCHLNSRNLPSPHRPTGEGDQVLFEKTTSWACKAVLLAHERPLQLSLPIGVHAEGVELCLAHGKVAVLQRPSYFQTTYARWNLLQYGPW